MTELWPAANRHAERGDQRAMGREWGPADEVVQVSHGLSLRALQRCSPCGQPSTAAVS